ncbi:MAG TPA: J domain-containing protein [Mycobacterium sp.]|nr:J domain-containing protein [Mycobacterium sp.]
MVNANPDPYLVLGVPPTASQAEITHAYRTHLRAHHPDTRPARSAHTADERLRQVLAAYALLRDPARRADYDRLIADTPDTQPHIPAGPTPADHPPAGPVQIPITYHRHNTHTIRVAPSPLRVGPVRRHR